MVLVAISSHLSILFSIQCSQYAHRSSMAGFFTGSPVERAPQLHPIPVTVHIPFGEKLLWTTLRRRRRNHLGHTRPDSCTNIDSVVRIHGAIRWQYIMLCIDDDGSWEGSIANVCWCTYMEIRFGTGRNRAHHRRPACGKMLIGRTQRKQSSHTSHTWNERGLHTFGRMVPQQLRFRIDNIQWRYSFIRSLNDAHNAFTFEARR